MEKQLKFLVIGKTGGGKSATANSILGEERFVSKASGRSVTKTSQTGEAERFGRKLLVVDTPGVFDAGKTNSDVLKEIVKYITLTSPGLHAIIMVIQHNRFTDEEKNTIDLFLNHLGEDMLKFTIIVFTGKDQLDREKMTIDEFVDSFEPSSELAKIVKKCKSRYVAFDNTAGKQQIDEQVKILFSLIDKMIKDNGEDFYTNAMYEEAQKAYMYRRQKEEEHENEKKRRQDEHDLSMERIRSVNFVQAQRPRLQAGAFFDGNSVGLGLSLNFYREDFN